MDEPHPDVVDEWLRLRHSYTLSMDRALTLVKRLGDPATIFESPDHVLSTILGSRSVNPSVYSHYNKRAVALDKAWLRQSEFHHIIPWNDPRYPTLLKEIPDPPLLLYTHGDPTILAHPQLAIVGSRNPTRTGVTTAYEFARGLHQCGLAVTSGLAIGIDAAAHRGAVSIVGSTIAVAATGLDRIYPKRHHKLAMEILEHGALVSEFAIATPVRRSHFPQRNRLISGLSLGTLVVEANTRSGSLITARFANEQGREVYAIPGSIHSPLARGCHRLIRDGAKLVESIEDITEELGQFFGLSAGQGAPKKKPTYNVEFSKLLALMGYDPVSVDLLVQRSGLTADTVSSMLLRMELDGAVESLNIGQYIRTQ